MKTRVITVVLLLPLLLICVLALPKVCTAILWGVMAAIAAWELLVGTGYVKSGRVVVYSMVMAFCVAMHSYAGMPYAWGLAGILVFVTLLFMEMMLSHVKLSFDKVVLCFAAGVLIPYLFCSLVRIHNVDGTGRYFIILPFVMAFLSDTGAYLVGRKLGKHKLAPAISPKKTVEGAIGGLIGAVVGMLIYGAVLQFCFGFTVNYGYAVIYGLLGSVGGMFGDLCFSVIKRQVGLKDYGKLFPGHGGILDRFDSMMIVGPLAELLLILIPVAVK